MKKSLIVCISLCVFLLLPSISYAEVLDEEVIRSKVKEKYVEDVLLLNSTISGDDVTFCPSKSNTFDFCAKMFPEAKYILDTDKKIASVVVVDNNGNSHKNPTSKIERIFFDLIFERYDSIAEGGLQKKSSKAEHGDVNQLLSTSSSFGYGSDWCSGVPDMFPSACQSHDFCYDAGTYKAVCDEAFKDNMWRFIKDWKSVQPAWYKITQAYWDQVMLFSATANAYFYGVIHLEAAWDAYCNAQGTPSLSPECQEGYREMYLSALEDSTDARKRDFETHTGSTFSDNSPRGSSGISSRLAYMCDIYDVFTNGSWTGTYFGNCSFTLQPN